MAGSGAKKYTPAFHESVVPVVQRQTSSGASFDDLSGDSGGGRIHIQIVDEEVVAALSQPTTLECRVPQWKGKKGVRVRWMHEGHACEGDKYLQFRDDDLQYLYIKDTNLEDGGCYVVVAEEGDARAEKGIKVRIAQPQPPTTNDGHTSIAMEKFPAYVKKIKNSYDTGEEFFRVELQWDVTQHSANLQCNMHKNRYCNVFPYDHTRVVLSLLEGVPGSDYINASHIQDVIGGGWYIASQGPLPHTYADFWRMIWEQDVHVVAMVTKSSHHFGYQEPSYWPEKVKQEMTFDDITVTLTDREETRHWIKRSISIHYKQSSGKSEHRDVVHFQFISWPEYGVPKRPTDLLTFRKEVMDYYSKSTGPLLVHCSAGVGRTGTFICIDMLIRRLAHTSKVDVFSLVRELRFKRERTVETPEQYILVHEALAEVISSN